MATRMVTLTLTPGEATLAHVRAKYDLARDDVDEHFGVVALSPEQNLYAILVQETVAARLESQRQVSVPYANPKIEPYGPKKR